MKVRIWSEFLRPEDVCRDNIIGIFKKYEVFLNYKLEYMDFSEELFNMISTYNENSIPVSLWATLSDDMGYWINEDNVDKFGDYVHKTVDILEKRGLGLYGFCIDMEPPYNLVMKLYYPKNIFDKFIFYTTLATKNLNRKKYDYAVKKFNDIAGFMKAKGLESYVPVTREIYYDIKYGTDFIQNALQTPAFEVSWDRYNLMYYATMMRKSIKNYDSQDVDYLIYRQVKFMKEKYGDRISISAGLTNTGKLGNEPCYGNIGDFIHDIGILKGAGVEDITIFSLDGMLDPVKLESFIKGVYDAEPIIPQPRKRVIYDENKNKRLMNIAKGYYKMF